MISFFVNFKVFKKKTGRNFGKFHFFKLHKKHIFCKVHKMFCLVCLQHHKDQLEVVIWVKDNFKKGLCQKINIFAFFTQKVPLNSQAFLGIRICDKNNLSTRAHHLNNTKI